MKKQRMITVVIKETLTKKLYITATDENEALGIVEDRYHDGEIEPQAGVDSFDVEFEIMY